jgi:hypothetical protein
LLIVKGGAATSDFLLSLLVSASFMRLSSLKAARVAVGEYRAARNPGQAAFFSFATEDRRSRGENAG